MPSIGWIAKAPTIRAMVIDSEIRFSILFLVGVGYLAGSSASITLSDLSSKLNAASEYLLLNIEILL